MEVIIKDKLKIIKQMDMVNFIKLLVTNIKANGNSTCLMEQAKQIIQMVVDTSVNS